jgi:2-oxoglutarate ferredoxin oxidoreductase subunit gamma
MIMVEHYEMRFSGTGGQGLLMAGILIAEAAIRDGKNAIQTQSYGPESRGGASKSEVIISEDEILYPKATVINFCLAVSQEAYAKYHKDLKPGGMLVVDPFYVLKTDPGEKFIALPFAQSAKEKLGRELVANVIACGAIAELTKIVTIASLEKSLYGRVPKGTEEKNKQALALGVDLVKAWKTQSG